VTVGLILTVGCVELGQSSGSTGGDDGDDVPAGQELLATFDVTADKDDVDCGTGQLVLDDSWSFVAKLTRDEAGEHVYWDVGKGPKEGSLDADGLAFALSSTVVVDMRTPEDASWLPQCHIQRTDELGGELNDAHQPTAFEGHMSFHFEPTEGSDCSDLLVGPEHILQRLPCNASYTLAATAQPGEGGAGGDGAGAGGDDAAGGAGGLTE